MRNGLTGSWVSSWENLLWLPVLGKAGHMVTGPEEQGSYSMPCTEGRRQDSVSNIVNTT